MPGLGLVQAMKNVRHEAYQLPLRSLTLAGIRVYVTYHWRNQDRRDIIRWDFAGQPERLG